MGVVPCTKDHNRNDMLNEKALIKKNIFSQVAIHKERLRSSRWIILPSRFATESSHAKNERLSGTLQPKLTF